MSYFYITILSYLYTFDEVLGHFALEPNERWSSDIVDLLRGSFIGFLIICLSRAALVLIKSKKWMTPHDGRPTEHDFDNIGDIIDLETSNDSMVSLNSSKKCYRELHLRITF